MATPNGPKMIISAAKAAVLAHAVDIAAVHPHRIHLAVVPMAMAPEMVMGPTWEPCHHRRRACSIPHRVSNPPTFSSVHKLLACIFRIRILQSGKSCHEFSCLFIAIITFSLREGKHI